jgi:outer membrane protein assembly factor BamA
LAGWAAAWLCLAAAAHTPAARGEERAPAADDSSGFRSRFIPAPVLYYTPETKLAYGAAAAYIFKMGEGAEVSRSVSNLGGIAVYTALDQVMVSFGANLHTPGDRREVAAGVEFSRFPTELYGLGMDAPDATAEDYTPVHYRVSLEALRRVSRTLRMGLDVQFLRHRVRQVEEGGLLARRAIPGWEAATTVRIGPVASLDTRDHPGGPTRGAYLRGEANLYDGVLGSDREFAQILLDLRFFQPWIAGQVSAAQIVATATLGEAPYYLMPALGGSRLFRGALEGRYRQHQLLALQAEHRVPLRGRLGLVGFAAIGQVTRRVGDLEMRDFRLSGGLGLRIVILPAERLRIRLDQAWSGGDRGFYLAVGESF